MKKHSKVILGSLNKYCGGWIIGSFIPHVLPAHDHEVGIKTYEAGEINKLHTHKLTNEVNIIVSGLCEFNTYDPLTEEKQTYTLSAADFILIPKNIYAEFIAIEKTTLVVYKDNSVPDDKYVMEN